MTAVRRAVGIVILLISLVVLVWGIWPQETVVRTFPEYLITPSISPLHSDNPENRMLVLEWSHRLRVGDDGFLRVQLVNDQETTPLSATITEIDDPGVGNHADPNTLSIQNVIVEARLEMAGMQFIPSGEISESLRQGQPVMFLWNLRTPKVGIYRGTIWLHIRYLPFSGEGEIRKVLSASKVEIESINLMGLSGISARVLGSVGLSVGAMLGLDGLMTWFWNLLIKSLRSGMKS